MNDKMQRAIGNVIDKWENLPNDVRYYPGFEELDEALKALYGVIVEEIADNPPPVPFAGA